MGRNRKTYSESFKKEVAVEAIKEKRPVAEIAAQFGISPSMVTTWKKAFLNGEFSKELQKLRKELEESKKIQQETFIELGKHQLEVAILKKKLGIITIEKIR